MPQTSVTGMPSAVKPFRTTTRTWNSSSRRVPSQRLAQHTSVPSADCMNFKHMLRQVQAASNDLNFALPLALLDVQPFTCAGAAGSIPLAP